MVGSSGALRRLKRRAGAPDGATRSLCAVVAMVVAIVVAGAVAVAARARADAGNESTAPTAAAVPVASPSASAATGRGPLRVGTSGDYAPFSMVGPDGALTGLDVEIARAYARDLGRELELVRFRWPELEARLTAGEFDIAMSGVTVRSDRLVRGPMTAAVARADAVVLVRRGTSFASLARDGAGTTVAVNRGGHLERVARARLPQATIVAVDDNRSLPDRLSSSAVDAIVTDTIEASAFAGAGLDAEVAATLARDRKAYWAAPGGFALVADLDTWLAAREADGTLGRLRGRFAIVEREDALGGSRRAADIAARRLALMPLVAEAKRARSLPIDAPGREAAIESAARAAAARAGLDEEAYLELVRAQIEAAKLVQRAVLAEVPPRGSAGSTVAAAAAGAVPGAAPGAGSGAGSVGASPGAASFDLDRDLRPAIDALDAAMRAELARSAPLSASPSAIATAIAADAAVPGIDSAAAERIGRALKGIPAVQAR